MLVEQSVEYRTKSVSGQYHPVLGDCQAAAPEGFTQQGNFFRAIRVSRRFGQSPAFFQPEMHRGHDLAVCCGLTGHQRGDGLVQSYAA